MMNCKEATKASVKMTEGPLPIKNRFDLWMHLLFCKYCKMFDRQQRWLDRILQSPSNEEAALTSDEKELLKSRIHPL